jgi:integrase
VNILKYIKVADKWRFAPAHTSNNKLKTDWVLIDGKPERHPEGTYYIEWYENKRRCRQSVKDPVEVLEQARRKAIELDAEKAGIEVADGEFCSNWFLHKFRHTFATRNLQEHVCDIRTLQLWLGHSDLASTMVYLKAVRNKDVAARVNGSELAAFAVATIGTAQAQAVQ